MSFDDLMFRDDVSAYLIGAYKPLADAWGRRRAANSGRYPEGSYESFRDLFGYASYASILDVFRKYDSGVIPDRQMLVDVLYEVRDEAISEALRVVRDGDVFKHVSFDLRSIYAEAIEAVIRAGECDE